MQIILIQSTVGTKISVALAVVKQCEEIPNDNKNVKASPETYDQSSICYNFIYNTKWLTITITTYNNNKKPHESDMWITRSKNTRNHRY